MLILNLGCGTKASSNPDVINIDWSIYLRLKRSNLFRPLVPIFIRGERLDKFLSIPDNIAVYDLAKGIPYNSNSVDVVYHSHLLEHLDRDIAEIFLREVRRVLKPNGIHRIVVPNFEEICREYLSHVAICENNIDEAMHHDSYIAAIIEQSVRKEAYGTGQQKIWRRQIENILLGDARRRGETHQWMYVS